MISLVFYNNPGSLPIYKTACDINPNVHNMHNIQKIISEQLFNAIVANWQNDYIECYSSINWIIYDITSDGINHYVHIVY